MVFRSAREQPGYVEWRETENHRREPISASAWSAANFLVGTWLVMAPFVLGFVAEGEAVSGYWNEILIGATVAMLSLVRAFMPGEVLWFSVVNAVLGLWLVLSPFLLGHEKSDAMAAAAIDVSAGLFILTAATASVVLTCHRHRRSSNS